MPAKLPGAAVPLSPADVASRLTKNTSPAATRTFSSTSRCQKISLGRRRFYDWLESRSATELETSAGRPNYLGPHPYQPFPANPLFRSQPVLDDAAREMIWDKVTRQGQSIKAVSAELGVDIRRVGAVVRLKEVQRQWELEGQKLATPYAKAVLGMLPKTSYREGETVRPHEPINEVLVHKLTTQQLFVPVAESRHFTREDAAKAFHKGILSADKRSAHPELIEMERRVLEGVDKTESMVAFEEATQKEEEAVAKRIAKQQEREEAATTRVRTDRYEFRFREINADDVGRNGRSRKGTGWRYGAPFDDRKRGAVKIPTSVP